MKLPSLLLAAFSAATLSVRAEVSPIHMSVETVRKTEQKKADPKNQAAAAHDKTQVISLKIQLDNNSSQAFDGLNVKYWFLGHAMTEHGLKALVVGERKSSIAPRGKDIVESEVVSKHYVEAHNEVAKGGKAGSAAKTTKVPASGEKIIGYAVHVIKDGKVLAEYYSDPAYKALVTSEEKAPAPEPAKKK